MAADARAVHPPSPLMLAPAKARKPRLTPAEKARIEAIFTRFEAAEPAPKAELLYASPFTLLVAVVLSAQATDKSVNLATRTLYPIADTPAAVLALGEAALTEHIKRIGLYRSKAKNVITLSQILVEQHGGDVPLDREALQALPGVGRKTASVVLNELGAEEAIAVDTHVFRVSHRLKLSRASTPDKVEQDLLAKVPPRFKSHAHHWLILHGRYTCVARRPKCEVCIIADLCPTRVLYMGE